MNSSVNKISGDIAHDGIELRDCNTKHNEILTNTISVRDLAWEWKGCNERHCLPSEIGLDYWRERPELLARPKIGTRQLRDLP
jgi:hypothetical protein